MKELLIKLNACKKAQVWAEGKSWQEIYTTCHRGDWLLWLFKKTNRGDLKLLMLVKAYCADTVRHLMQDSRSTNAIDVAIKFGNDQATREELNNAAADAAAAYAAHAAAYARKENQLLTANVVRQYIPIELWNIKN